MTTNKPLKPYWYLYLVPVLMLLAVFAPMNFKQLSIYLGLCVFVVGAAAVILGAGYLIFFEPSWRNPPSALLFLVIMIFYNPIVMNYSLAYKLEALNHQYLIFCNLCIAAIFVYKWWESKRKNKQA